MSEGCEFPLAEALAIAERYRHDLAPMCQRIELAGSARRQKAVVHDLEFVLIPKWEIERDMFGSPVEISLLQMGFSGLARQWGAKVIKDGPKYKQLILSEGLPLDIFISDTTRWGVELLIRTGPAEFSKRCVTARKAGGLLPSNCAIKDGWKVYRGATVLPMPDEKDFLELLGLGWTDPRDRKG